MTPLELILTGLAGGALGGAGYAAWVSGFDLRTIAIKRRERADRAARARRIAELDHAADVARRRLALAAQATARPPAPLPLFPDPPRSIKPSPRPVGTDRSWFYVPAPGPASVDWRGADWSSPVALTFETKVIRASRFGVAAQIGPEPMPPDVLVGAVVDLWRAFLRGLDTGRMVVDQQSRPGVELEPVNFGHRSVVPQVRMVVHAAVCWPAVEGVTTPRRPGWQDVTR